MNKMKTILRVATMIGVQTALQTVQGIVGGAAFAAGGDLYHGLKRRLSSEPKRLSDKETESEPPAS